MPQTWTIIQHDGPDHLGLRQITCIRPLFGALLLLHCAHAVPLHAPLRCRRALLCLCRLTAPLCAAQGHLSPGLPRYTGGCAALHPLSKLTGHMQRRAVDEGRAMEGWEGRIGGGHIGCPHRLSCCAPLWSPTSVVMLCTTAGARAGDDKDDLHCLLPGWAAAGHLQGGPHSPCIKYRLSSNMMALITSGCGKSSGRLHHGVRVRLPVLGAVLDVLRLARLQMHPGRHSPVRAPPAPKPTQCLGGPGGAQEQEQEEEEQQEQEQQEKQEKQEQEQQGRRSASRQEQQQEEQQQSAPHQRR